ncbi:SET and MYND domain-containing protein 4-like isoform X1 [Macrobrachium nipponense]|uniref:SET and MYND domain-containing protein 4-like isoform X1 n=1 Tax=Macrobrachium nipponense TaxID=159736 RepID=UPI0030C7E884
MMQVSDPYSAQPLFDKLTHVAVKTGSLHRFARKRNLIDKVKFCWNINVVYDKGLRISFKNELQQILKILYKKCDDHGKSEKLALEAKEKGSKEYVKKKDVDAQHSFTESLRLAPEDSPVLPLAYGNRSAVLFQLKKYKEALTDIKRAVDSGYPNSILHKLLPRRCLCFIKLGDKIRAEAALELCKKHVSVIPSEAKEKYQKTLQDLEKKVKELQPGITAKPDEPLPLPALYKGESSNVTYMSCALEMRVNEPFGRYVVAAEPIQRGSVVFVEKPYAAILLPEYHLTHCHSCFMPTANPIPCRSCRDAIFCNEECREKAHVWHQYECGILHILSAVGIAHLALRVILVTGWKVYSKISTEDVKDRIPGLNNHRVYGGRNPTDAYRAVYHLMPHLDTSCPEDQLQYCLAALLLSSAVLDKTLFSKQKNDGQDITVIQLGTAVMRHIAQLVANAHAITQVVSERPDESSHFETVAQKRIASAIYPTASLMNHSCQPTIINSFINEWLVVRTIQDVKQGEQVYNCYGPHYCRQTYKERQEILKHQYFFLCLCGPCSQPQYRLREAAWSGFHCESCKGISTWTVNGKRTTDDSSSNHGLMACLECHRMEKPSHELVQICTKVSALHEDAEDAWQKGDLSNAIMKLRTAIKLGSKVYLSQNHFFLTLKDTLAKMLAESGDFVACCDILRECVRSVEYRYGSQSVELGHELLKFSDVLEQAAAKDDRFNGELHMVTSRIDKIFTINYGPLWKKYLRL